MKERLKEAISRLVKKGAQYADARHERIESESIRVRDVSLDSFSRDSSAGVGIRALYKGAWGFASGHARTDDELMLIADMAFGLAKTFSAINREKVRLAPVERYRDSYKTPCVIDPFKVAPDEKLKTLFCIAEAALRHKAITSVESFMEFKKTRKIFVSSIGSEIAQTILTSGAGYSVNAEGKGDLQRRSFPDAHHGLFSTKGFELIDELDMVNSVEKTADEARMLLVAPKCPSGEKDIILDGSQMALQLHESCGHPTELDRALGSEAGFAGGSFLDPAMAGSFKYGSKVVNIYADPNERYGAGSYKYDDEGVRARRVDIVKDGIFTGFLSSRECAGKTGIGPDGSMRGDGWSKAPLVRMSNVCIEPGTPTLEELIADTKDGIFFLTNRSWSIDDKRLNFQFGTEMAYEIKRGRVRRVFKDPVYFGVTPSFWGSCDAVCSKKDWRMWGLDSCAKGEPLQIASVGHGTSPARFRRVMCGVAE